MAKGIRRQGRELALKILYSLPDHEGGTLEDVFADFWRNFRFSDDLLGEADEAQCQTAAPQARQFAEQLVAGVAEQLERIDRLITDQADNWGLDRMARVDLALLRLARTNLLKYGPIQDGLVVEDVMAMVGKWEAALGGSNLEVVQPEWPFLRPG